MNSSLPSSNFQYLTPQKNIKNRDVLEIVYDGITAHSHNYYRFFQSLHVGSNASIHDFIKALVKRFNLFQQQGLASSDLPTEVASYQVKQLKKLEKLAQKTMNEPVRYADFTKFLSLLGKSISLHNSMHARVGRFASTMNHPGYNGVERIDKIRKLYGMEIEYDTEAMEQIRAARRRPAHSYLSSEEDEDMDETSSAVSGRKSGRSSTRTRFAPSGYGASPFAPDPENTFKLELKQKPSEKYKAFGTQPEHISPREAQQQQNKKIQRLKKHGSNSRHSLSASRDFRVKENRAHLMRTKRIRNHVNTREEKKLTALFGPKMAKNLLASQQERASSRLESRARPKSAGAAASRRRRAGVSPQTPSYAQPIQRSIRSRQRPQSGRSSFTATPSHLLNSSNPSVRVSH